MTKKILVVDDDTRLLSLIIEYLELKNYQVTPASTGLKALEFLRSDTFRVLITDIVLPDISGIALIDISQKEFPDLKIIAMTGFSKQVKKLISEKSPDYFFEKPVKLNVLSKALEALTAE